MSDADDAIVFRTTQAEEVPSLAARLADAGVPFEIRIAVQPEREKEALAQIEAYMHSIGAAPNEDRPDEPGDEESLLPCPNCDAVGIALDKTCAGCGFRILRTDAAPALVAQHAPGARSFCPECRDPLTFPSGKCGTCGEELEPLEPGDRLCPTLQHVLYRDTVGGFVCKVCERVWVDLVAS